MSANRTRIACQIEPVAKRRDGGTRYWCLRHKADATAKYGRPAVSCRRAHLPALHAWETASIDLRQYRGGIALWGAVPPVYDTTSRPLDRGVHVHARRLDNGLKHVDATFRSVRLRGGDGSLAGHGLVISELDAIYYMVTSVLGFESRFIACTLCSYPHLDKDWFSVHPHQRHLCAGCGRTFRDTAKGLGNPIGRILNAFGGVPRAPLPATRSLDIRQSEFPGGLQIWGSNPAIVWTGRNRERSGIHVHAFRSDSPHALPDEDDTFSRVVIDGVGIDPVMVRTLMAQSALPHLAGRVVSQSCPRCGAAAFARGEAAFHAVSSHRCQHCSQTFPSVGKLRNLVPNPLVDVLRALGLTAPRPPRSHDIGLLPETP